MLVSCWSPRTGRSTSLGPVAAIGVACVLLAGLTLLPAMLAIGGRRAFWPRKQVVAFDPEHAVTGGRRLVAALRRPRAAAARAWRSTAQPARCSRSAPSACSPTRRTTAPRRSSRSRRRASTASRCWSARSRPARCAPTNVLVERENGPVRPADVAAARRLAALAARSRRGDAACRRARATAASRGSTSIFKDDPYHEATLNRIPKLRDRLDAARARTCGRSWAAGPRSSTTTPTRRAATSRSSCRSRSC